MRHIPLAAAVTAAMLLTGCTATPKPVKTPPVKTPVDYTAWEGGTSKPVADPIYPQHGTDALDVLHYGLELSWDPAAKALTGTATLRVRPTETATELSLDFKPYELDAVTVDDAPVTAKVTQEKLVVPAGVTADKLVTLVVKYHGKPSTTPMPSHRSDSEPLGLTVTKDGGLWTMQEPYGAFTWYPANDQPSDEALYDIAVTVPQGWTAIASGTPAGQEGTTFRYTSKDPVATYLTTLAVGKYKKISAKGPRGIPLTYWYRGGTDDKLVGSLKKSPKYLEFLEKRFGPYPFPSGGIVIVDSESGMETQQMITMGGKVGKFTAERRQGYETDLLHEYAHQWFGDSVTPTTWTDLWLSEGWATYTQFLWDQQVFKFDDATLETYLRKNDATLRKKIGPPGSPKAANFAESNVYICPAAMLNQLHQKLGDKKFFALGRAWVQTQKNTQQDRATFIAFVKTQTGTDYSKLINTWLDAKTTPA
jgi:aminopeptidase N